MSTRQRSASRNRGRMRTNSTGAGTGDMTTVAMNAGTGYGTGEFKTVCCLLNNVNLMIDLGAKATLINQAIYNKCFSNIKLERLNVRLTSYDGTGIESLGCLYVSVQYESNTVEILFSCVSGGRINNGCGFV